MKKTVASVVATLVASSLFFSACSVQSRQTVPNDTTSMVYSDVVTGVGQFPIVKQPVTFHIFAGQTPNISDINTNEFTTMYEKKTGVHIEWELCAANAIADKKSLSLASGDYPDAYMGGITREDVMNYGPQGVFVALDNYIKLYNPELQKLFAQDKTILPTITAKDGHIYSYPNPSDTKHMTVASRMWINSTFLKTLGLSVPKTTDEFYNALVAVKTKDPNGNKKADEIPLIFGAIGGAQPLGQSGISFLMSAFVYYDGVDGFIVSDNDKVSLAYNQPGWKKGLAYLKKLYSEKLIDQTSFTVTLDQIKQLIEKKDAMTVFATTAQGPSQIMNTAGDRYPQYDSLVPLKGPDGVQLTAYTPYITGPFSMVITKNCKNPEIFARWVDWLYTFEGALTAREGPQGKGWKVPAPGTLSYSGIPATWQRITTYGVASNWKWDGMTFPHNMLIHPQMASNPADTRPLEPLLYSAAVANIKYTPNKVLPPLFMDTDIIKEYSKMKTEINALAQEYAARFITGDADLDKDWNTYITELNNLGIAQYIKYTQDTYNAFLKINGQPKYVK